MNELSFSYYNSLTIKDAVFRDGPHLRDSNFK